MAATVCGANWIDGVAAKPASHGARVRAGLAFLVFVALLVIS